jgi:hypothetical protein
MAADGQILQGEVNESPKSAEIDVEAMLTGFLKALIEEQASDEALANTTEAGRA